MDLHVWDCFYRQLRSLAQSNEQPNVAVCALDES